VRPSGGEREEVSSGGGRGYVEAGGEKEKHDHGYCAGGCSCVEVERGNGGEEFGRLLERNKKLSSSQATVTASKLDMGLKNGNAGWRCLRISPTAYLFL
jgi:hypothetical protein